MTDVDGGRLSPAQAARLLRAKAAELEHHFAGRMENATPGDSEVLWCIADIALIAGILADHIDPEIES